jgi:hypothetical protein
VPEFVRTYKRRKAFLDALEAGNSDSGAASLAGGTLRQFRKWAAEDPNFEQDWKDAVEAGSDFIEDVATTRAIKKSDTLMLAILKARKPEKYDRGGKLELSGTVNVEGSRQKLLNRLAKIQAAAIANGTPAVPALPSPDD